MRNKIYLLTLKYSYPVLILFSLVVISNPMYAFVGLIELFLIFLITDLLLQDHKWLGQIFNYIFLLIFNIQFTVLFFSNSFISLVMLNNIDSVEAISSKFGIYAFFMVLLFVTTIIPSHPIKRKWMHWNSCVCIVTFLCLFILTFTIFNNGTKFSAFANLYYLADAYHEQKTMYEQVMNNSEVNSSKFFKEKIDNFKSKPDTLSVQPNIILIFTEGLSQNIISDERTIMPNVKKLQNQSISFINYYNHTFATYMGLSGQLHSGYQMQNYDKNELVSLHDIFKMYGYKTSFINVEPYNEEFTTYLAEMEFDNLLNNIELATSQAKTISDKDAYEYLYDYCVSEYKKGISFFTVIYTLGTHTQWICPDEKFDNGSNNYLNKFYNADYQFGKFIEKFNSSELSENTIIIFTTDHATYQDSDFTNSFPEHVRTANNVDEIPLFIYYPGVQAEIIDVNGKNSLDLAPTILDFLDFSGPNYFLGTSLFGADNINEYDTIFQSVIDVYSTDNDEIKFIEATKKNIIQKDLEEYFKLKLYGTGKPYITTNVYDAQTMEVVLYNAPECDMVHFPIWSINNGQDDIVWYKGTKEDDGTWRCMMDKKEAGTYVIHVYKDMGTENQTFILEYLLL